jgi:hypothetical protein
VTGNESLAERDRRHQIAPVARLLTGATDLAEHVKWGNELGLRFLRFPGTTDDHVSERGMGP